MRCPDRSPDEPGRLRALAQYRIDPELGLPGLDGIVGMAADLLGCPGAAVNMVGEERVLLVSQTGLGACDLSRDASFCAHAINQDDLLIVEDAALDERFHDNPLVGSGTIRFYAGVALRAPSGHALGALCVVDTEPRTGLSPADRARLLELARLATDQLELRRLEVASLSDTSRFAATARSSSVAILCCDESGSITSCNEQAASMFGWTEPEMMGRQVESLIVGRDRRLARRTIRQALHGQLPISQNARIGALRRNGSTFTAEVRLAHWYEKSHLHFGIILHDVTEGMRERDTLYFLQNHDALTSLPNRNMVVERIRNQQERGSPVSLIHTSLRGFADVSNTLGHAVGDRVASTLAARIRSAIPAEALVARLAGDEFATVLSTRDPLVVVQVARTIADAVAQPLQIDEHDIWLSSHSGVALAPDHGNSPDELLGNAELAVLEAAGLAPGSTSMFTPQLRARAVARRLFDAAVHRAYEQGEFVLHFQPQVLLKDGAVTGAEALIRWQHPQRGELLPAAFMQALEDHPISDAVGAWVIDTACAHAALWRRAHPGFEISVNLSASQFRSGKLVDIVDAALARHQLPPEALELEITENIALDDHQTGVLPQLEALRDRQVRLSFDDFGTGFASLNLLRSFPVTHIKIDKSFVQFMRTSKKDWTIVRNLIRMAHDLGLQVIAEGVEDLQAVEALRQFGCDKAQGFHFGVPCRAGRFVDLYLPYESPSSRAGSL